MRAKLRFQPVEPLRSRLGSRGQLGLGGASLELRLQRVQPTAGRVCSRGQLGLGGASLELCFQRVQPIAGRVSSRGQPGLGGTSLKLCFQRVQPTAGRVSDRGQIGLCPLPRRRLGSDCGNFRSECIQFFAVCDRINPDRVDDAAKADAGRLRDCDR